MDERADEELTLRGRQAEARRNDTAIMDAALEVFSADAAAPMSAVAQAADVGQATLYRRYANRETLLIAVSRRGLTAIADAVRTALAASAPGPALVWFLRWYTESGTLRMMALLGSFDPPDDLFALAHEANVGMQELVELAVSAGAVRSDITGADLTQIATQVGAVTATDPERARELRRRYLELILQALALIDTPPLPGPAPDADELETPWRDLS